MDDRKIEARLGAWTKTDLTTAMLTGAVVLAR
jgi:hypothetical protein